MVDVEGAKSLNVPVDVWSMWGHEIYTVDIIKTNDIPMIYVSILFCGSHNFMDVFFMFSYCSSLAEGINIIVPVGQVLIWTPSVKTEATKEAGKVQAAAIGDVFAEGHLMIVGLFQFKFSVHS